MTRYLLDTSVLIWHLRGDRSVEGYLLELLARGHRLGTSCVCITEIVRGLAPRERKQAFALLDRLDFLPTTREAARRAGEYQATFKQRGQTIHTPDALIAGTARAHGAIVVTENESDFPMKDIRTEPFPRP